MGKRYIIEHAVSYEHSNHYMIDFNQISKDKKKYENLISYIVKSVDKSIIGIDQRTMDKIVKELNKAPTFDLPSYIDDWFTLND